MNIRKIFEFTAIIFIAITVISLSKASRKDVSTKYSSTLRLSSFTTIIAGLHYFLMALSAVFQKDALAIIMYRYADWIITTPVLLIELLVLLGIDGNIWFSTELIIANIIMLLFGFYGEIFTDFSIKVWSGILGFLPLMYIIWRVYKSITESQQNDDTKTRLRYGVAIGFALLWVLYGVVYFLDSQLTRSVLYTVLDLLSKGVFAGFVYGFGNMLIN